MPVRLGPLSRLIPAHFIFQLSPRRPVHGKNVIETKGTNNLEDPRALTESERLKIKCAMKHFGAIGVEAKLDYRTYHAPVKDYQPDFKDKLTV